MTKPGIRFPFLALILTAVTAAAACGGSGDATDGAGGGSGDAGSEGGGMETGGQEGGGNDAASDGGAGDVAGEAGGETGGGGFSLTSSAYADGGDIPNKYSCNGAGTTPPLAWSGAPAGTKSFVFILDDPDAPKTGGFVHWVLYDIPGDLAALGEGLTSGTLPPGILVGINDAGKTEYQPPCPPSGKHHYVHSLYAVSEASIGAFKKAPTRDEVLTAIKSLTLGKAVLTGLYAKP